MTTLIDGLFAHWRLDEATGTRSNAIGGNDLAQLGTVGQTTGKIGSAASFPGTTTDYLEATPPRLDLTGGFTLAGWCKPTALSPVNVLAIIFNGSGEPFGLGVNDGTPPQVFGYMEADDGSFAAPLANGGAAGAWFFFVAWYDPATKTSHLQINDGTVASDALPSGIRTDTTGQVLWLGTDGGNSLDGALDSVSLWTRVLTAGERTALYNGALGLDFPFGVALAAGSYSDPARVLDSVDGYGNAAVTANQYLVERVFAFPAKLGGVQVHADTAGTGSGSTVVDVLLNGASVYHQASDRPWLAAQNSGAFNQANPPTTVAIERGDRLAIQVAGVSTTGHARLKAHVAIEKPFRIGV